MTDLTSEPFVKRELALIKVRCEAGQRRELSDLAAIFHGTICDVSLSTVTMEMQGKETKIGALQGLLAPYGAPHQSRCPIWTVSHCWLSGCTSLRLWPNFACALTHPVAGAYPRPFVVLRSPHA